jgi:hypothetical protein
MKGDQGVLVDTFITPKGTLRGGNTVVQAHHPDFMSDYRLLIGFYNID